ncbi:MAG: cysteine--tRNA ligase [Candidatus Kerfeldbacteria bacterium]|nr:cysteine--tRNA ligase [Candidatus Kerfeldbacteria bacterium]
MVVPDLNLFNSLTKKREQFRPLHDGRVGMYSCGLTVYNFAHLGNLRAYLFTDVLKRVLRLNGLAVRHVMNITDVGHLTGDADAGEDKVERAAASANESALAITRRYTDAFVQDLKNLNILLPEVMPKATEHIAEQIQLIQRLETAGFTYRTSDGVYFDTAKFPGYGRMANLDKQSLKEGARVEKNIEKRNPTDFALWKFTPKQTKRQMEWPSPWGVGFPGWHIECSAMSMKYLGETFDIHTGGVDHIPIHHTNEMAQSEAATGQPLARYWLHNEFLLTPDLDKMAKSAGNFLTLRSLGEKGYSPLAFRYLTLNTHYRKPLTFTWEALAAAQKAYDALVGMVRMWPEPKIGCAEFEQRFRDAVNADLNTPMALGVLWELVRSDYPDHAKHQSVNVFDEILGLGLQDLRALEIPDAVRRLAEERDSARRAKDFAKSDALRTEIQSAGFTVDDTEGGSVIRPARG